MSVEKTKHVSYEDLNSLKDLLSCGLDVIFITEYNGFYYVRLDSGDNYDGTVFKVDKKTDYVSVIHDVDYMLDIEENVTEIDPEELKKTLL